jgi:FkbM family methyltransferase
MANRFTLPGKALVQSALPAVSRAAVWKNTDTAISAFTAFLCGLRGVGWSPHLEDEARIAASLIHRDGFAVIDAGANVGRWAENFRRFARGTGRIFAIEPQPGAAAKIREREIAGCEVIEVALGREQGTLPFHTAGPTDTMASLYERRDTFGGNRQHSQFQVPVMRLDDFVAARGITQVDFMKMDLEGGELEALQGASECLRSGMIRALSFEFGISNINARVFFKDLFDLFREYDYRLFRITPGVRLIPVKEYFEDLEMFARTTTYIARRPAAI